MAITGGKITRLNKRLNLMSICALLLALCAVPNAGAAQANSQTPPLPAPGTYNIDPLHTFVYFSAWHHIVGSVRGRFDKVTGTLTVSQNPADCAVDVTIDTSTVDTQVAERDADLRSPAFFNVKDFPAATYRGRGLHHVSGDSWRLDGTLTIRGISVVVPVTFTFKGMFPDTKVPRASFHATAGTNRAKFDMTRDNKMELGVPPVPGLDVQIEIDVEADATLPDH